VPVNYFIGIDFVGFQRLIGGSFKGIEVNVSETLDDPWYPIPGEELNPCGKSPEEIADLTAKLSGFELERQFECRYEHLYFEPGLTHMEGGDALKYVRSRHGSAAGDFSRSQRQHEVLEGIKQKALSLGILDDMPGFFKAASQHVTTDLDLEVVQYLTPAIKAAKDFQVNKIILSTQNVLSSGQSPNGQSILLPKQGLGQWQPVHEFIRTELKL
jgi:anionic cell wall polymer biosynthesis LytR-Cps2A-Psr (LCP) family protein